MLRGGLEEKVLGAVGNVGHAILGNRESVEQLLGVVVRDGQDEVRPGKRSCPGGLASGRARICRVCKTSWLVTASLARLVATKYSAGQ